MISAAFADTDGFAQLLNLLHAPAWAGWIVSFIIGSGVLGGFTAVAMAVRDLINHTVKLVEIIKKENVSTEAKEEANGALDAIMIIMSKIPLPFVRSKIPFVQNAKIKIDELPSATIVITPTPINGGSAPLERIYTNTQPIPPLEQPVITPIAPTAAPVDPVAGQVG
jgi:hypothetical protein